MLLSLHVKNLALIEEEEVNFTDGLNILTGETGAGKSIIIGSINLALGARADRGVIRTGAEYALIELTFSVDHERQLEKLRELEPVPSDGGVAKLYRLPGAQGNVGLISPVSAHFCAECNRIRITADGKIKPCLHSSDEISIKGQDYDAMLETIRSAILSKPRWHGELSYSARSHANRNMNQIGG